MIYRAHYIFGHVIDIIDIFKIHNFLFEFNIYLK